MKVKIRSPMNKKETIFLFINSKKTSLKGEF